ncbi:MAG: YchJ family metal-binding protein [Gallionella sp.]|nr:YchJ family metal-binding protein [Gallionella sp.]
MKNIFCPCGNPKHYAACCGLYIDGQAIAPTAEVLMRSRYTAYTLMNEVYLLSTWHRSTRPVVLNLAAELPTKWLGLDVQTHQQQDAEHATVAFVARYKVQGRAQRLHELSRFVREDGRWFYVDGDVD